jgi:hypothetical protein
MIADLLAVADTDPVLAKDPDLQLAMDAYEQALRRWREDKRH